MQSIVTERVAWSVCRGTLYYPPMGKGRLTEKYRDTLQYHDLCINGWTDRDAVWIVGSDGPKESQIRRGFRFLKRDGEFWGKVRPLYSIGTFCRELCKNSWTDRFAIWVVYSGGANVPDDSLPEAVQKWLNRSIFHLGCGLRRDEETTSLIIFANWHHVANATEPCICCSTVAYFKLLWPLVVIIIIIINIFIITFYAFSTWFYSRKSIWPVKNWV